MSPRKIPAWILKDSKVYSLYKEEGFNLQSFPIILDIPEYPFVESLDDFIRILEYCNYWQKNTISLDIFEYGYNNKQEVCKYLIQDNLSPVSILYSNLDLAFKIASEKWDDSLRDNKIIIEEVNLAITIWDKINRKENEKICKINVINYEEYFKKYNACGKNKMLKRQISIPITLKFEKRPFPTAMNGYMLNHKTIINYCWGAIIPYPMCHIEVFYPPIYNG